MFILKYFLIFFKFYSYESSYLFSANYMHYFNFKMASNVSFQVLQHLEVIVGSQLNMHFILLMMGKLKPHIL